tara:strand:+ start:204 stop:335 length:132 start_codon:yes stop_codon:yes gene_type:complete
MKNGAVSILALCPIPMKRLLIKTVTQKCTTTFSPGEEDHNPNI